MKPYVRHASGNPLPLVRNCKDFLTPFPPFLPYVIYERPLSNKLEDGINVVKETKSSD